MKASIFYYPFSSDLILSMGKMATAYCCHGFGIKKQLPPFYKYFLLKLRGELSLGSFFVGDYFFHRSGQLHFSQSALPQFTCPFDCQIAILL